MSPNDTNDAIKHPQRQQWWFIYLLPQPCPNDPLPNHPGSRATRKLFERRETSEMVLGPHTGAFVGSGHCLLFTVFCRQFGYIVIRAFLVLIFWGRKLYLCFLHYCLVLFLLICLVFYKYRWEQQIDPSFYQVVSLLFSIVSLLQTVIDNYMDNLLYHLVILKIGLKIHSLRWFTSTNVRRDVSQLGDWLSLCRSMLLLSGTLHYKDKWQRLLST